MAHPKFVTQKSSGHLYFHLTAMNGEVILNSELYTWRGSAEDGIASVRTNSPLDERYDRRASKDGQRYFVLKCANGEVIGTSEMYTSVTAMENGIASVKRSAPLAGVVDEGVAARVRPR